MYKIIPFLFMILSSLLSFYVFSAEQVEMTYGGELPTGVSGFLDKMSTGFAGSLVINRVCGGVKEDELIKYNMGAVSRAINLNLPSKYRGAALEYFKNSLEQKNKAFLTLYKDKECSDLRQMDFIVSEYGFKF